MLDAVGISDPFTLEAPRWSPFRAVLPVVLLAPLALVRALLNWGPYRAVRPIAYRLAGAHVDVVSTYKVLLGALVMAVTWLVEAAAAGAWGGPGLGLALVLLAPASGFVALRWDERVTLRREVLRAWRLGATRAKLVSAVAARRAELVAEIGAELKPTP